MTLLFARSLAEIAFIAAIEPCSYCQDGRPVAWQIDRVDDTWRARAVCPRCQIDRERSFQGPPELAEVVVDDLELGGPEPSRLLTPLDFLNEIDRHVPALATAPSTLDGAAWEANRLAVDRVRTALRELKKFLRDDEIRIPAPSLEADLDLQLRPERYRGPWIRAALVTWDGVADAIARDRPRVEEGVPARRPSGIDFSGLALANAHLAKMDLEGARLANSVFEGSNLVRCRLTKAHLEQATFAEANAERCDFEDADLVASTWIRATCVACRFVRADLTAAQLNFALFKDCDLRDACFIEAVLYGAVFDRCDLRGVDLDGADLRGSVFMGCKFSGARGEPAAYEGWVVTNADLSASANRIVEHGPEEVLAELRSADALPPE